MWCFSADCSRLCYVDCYAVTTATTHAHITTDLFLVHHSYNNCNRSSTAVEVTKNKGSRHVMITSECRLIEISLSAQYLQQVGGSMVHGSYTASVALKTAGETDELRPTHLPSVFRRYIVENVPLFLLQFHEFTAQSHPGSACR